AGIRVVWERGGITLHLRQRWTIRAAKRTGCARYFCLPMRVADNRIHTVLGLYRSELAALYPEAEARAIARMVFHERMGLDASQLEIRKFESLSESELLKVYEPLKRLVAGEPLQYVLGTVRFHGLVLEVGPGV